MHLQTKKKKCDSKAGIYFGKGRKHCGKRRKCWLPAFSPVPTMLSRYSFSRVLRARIVQEFRVKHKSNVTKVLLVLNDDS